MFLKRHNAFKEYFINLDKDLDTLNDKIIRKRLKYLLLKHPECLMCDAFLWETTPQGYTYWLNLFNEWEKLIKTSGHDKFLKLIRQEADDELPW